MSKLALAAAIAGALTGTAYGQQPSSAIGTPSSASSAPLTHFYIPNYYKQNVYGSAGTKIAEVSDVLAGADGKIDGFVLSVVGGDEKKVVVPFDAVKSTRENNGLRLTMNITREQLDKASAFKVDNTFAQQNATTGVAPSGKAAVLETIPNSATAITNYYKQTVYDPADVKIGQINDVIVGNDGNISAFIIGVGGFLGVGEKDVAVPFNSIASSQRDGKWWLTMNASKDDLKSAPGYKYDKVKATWVPA